MSIQVVIQSSDADALVELFELDPSIIGGDLYRFTNTPTENPLTWGDNIYTPVPFETSGFEWSTTGTLPRPTFRISNVGNLVGALVNATQDLVGATITRYMTFKRFLADGDEPDGSAYLTKDVFIIRRKADQNPVYVEFELSAAMDQENKTLPGRQILKSACTHTYRLWNQTTGEFDYTKATCPYAGTNYFDANGNTTSAGNDRCGKSLDDCRSRFVDAALPFRGFPGSGGLD